MNNIIFEEENRQSQKDITRRKIFTWSIMVRSWAYTESFSSAGLLYVNIHTVAFPGGELRGQLIEGTLPDDDTGVSIPVANWALLLGGLLMATYTYFMIRRRT